MVWGDASSRRAPSDKGNNLGTEQELKALPLCGFYGRSSSTELILCFNSLKTEPFGLRGSRMGLCLWVAVSEAIVAVGGFALKGHYRKLDVYRHRSKERPPMLIASYDFAMLPENPPLNEDFAWVMAPEIASSLANG